MLKLSVPLFVMPGKTPPAPEVAIDGLKPAAKGVQIGIKASGSHHIQISKLEAQLLDNAGTAIASGENKTHLLRILPHRRVFVEVPIDVKACSKAKNMLVKVHAERLTEPYEQRIPLSDGNCQAAAK